MPRRTKDAPLDRLFAALANPTRRDILDALRSGPRTVGALASMFDMSQPSVSEHLRSLRESQLVEEHREGRTRVYRMSPGPLRELGDWLSPYERFWNERLAALDTTLDRMDHDD